MSKSGTTWTFSYDVNGMRTQRTAGSTTYNYIYHGSQLTHMTYGSNVLHFYYDASGRPLSVTYNGATYYYVLNLQGDVVALLDSSGVQVVGYRYDAWGRLLATTGTNSSLALHNPLRYRGYVYDRETGLYYLQSRYYNPEIGRFINADSVIAGGTENILGCNMYAYCFNNPVNMSEHIGHWPEPSTIFAMVAIAAIAVSIAAAAVVVAAVVAPAFVTVGGTVISTAAVAMMATTVGTKAATVAVVSTVAAFASSKVEEKCSQSYSVYFLEDQNGTIQYVGRVTDSGYNARMAYHYNTRGLTPKQRISGLSYAEARGLEEIG